MPRIRLAIVLPFAMLLAAPAFAQGVPSRPGTVQAAPAPMLHITGAGEYVSQRELGPRDTPGAGADADTIKLVENPRMVRQTRQVEAQMCRSFGFLFTVDNMPAGGLDLAVTSVHPPILHPGGRISTGMTYDLTLTAGPPGLVGFSFDEPWELVAGTWSFTVRLGDRVLTEQSFEVTPPADPNATVRGDCSAVTS